MSRKHTNPNYKTRTMKSRQLSAVWIVALVLFGEFGLPVVAWGIENVPDGQKSEIKKVERINTAIVPEPRKRRKNWMTRHAEFNARAKKGSIDLVFLGDSITEEWSVAGKDVWEKYYGSRKAVNFGFSGDRTQHILWRVDHGNVDGIEPKLVVLMIGTNNYTANSAEEISAGIAAVVERLKSKLPKSKILLMGLLPRDDAREATREMFAQINHQIAKLADDKTVYFLDISDRILTKDGAVSTEAMPDLVHLGEKGLEIWAEAIEPYVVKLLGPR